MDHPRCRSSGQSGGRAVSAAQALPKADAEAEALVAAQGWKDPAVRSCLAAGGAALESCHEAELAELAVPGGRAVSAGQALPKAGL